MIIKNSLIKILLYLNIIGNVFLGFPLDPQCLGIGLVRFKIYIHLCDVFKFVKTYTDVYIPI